VTEPASDETGDAELPGERRTGETVGQAFVRLNPDIDYQAAWGRLTPSFDSFTRAFLPEVNTDAFTRAVLSGINTDAVMRRLLPSFTSPALVQAVTPRWDNTNLVDSFAERVIRGTGFEQQISQATESLLPKFDEFLHARFESVFSETIERFNETFKRLRPRNLRDADDLDLELMFTVMTDEGIPFFLVPDGETALALLAAPDAAARRARLEARAEPVFDTCEDIVRLCVSGSLPFHGAVLRESIAAYRSGHYRSAQALAANVLDSAFREYESVTHRPYVVGSITLAGGIKGTDYIDTLEWRPGVALMPLVKAHDADQRSTPPKTTFTRNGTAHRVTSEQYTRGNAVHAVMLATSILGYVEGLW
jgi:hypothetical protein